MRFLVELLNRWGEPGLWFVWSMFWQSSLLITVVLVLEWALRRKLRAAVRYALWWVVLLKLVLPPALAFPTGLGWWLRSAQAPPLRLRPVTVVVTDRPALPPSLPAPRPAALMTPAREALSAHGLALCGMGAISFGLLVWIAARWRQTVLSVRRASPAPEWLTELVERNRRAFGLRLPVRVRVMDEAASPAVCGLFRPVILLPRLLLERLSLEQLRAVLLHEISHLRRADVWANCLQALLQAVYWWHPLVWVANARMRRVREEAVDDAVMCGLREEAGMYAPTLLTVAKLVMQRPLASLGLIGILESRSFLRQRIERLLSADPPRRAGLTVFSTVCVVAFGALAVPMGAEQGGKPPESVSSTETATNLISRLYRLDVALLSEAMKQHADGALTDEEFTVREAFTAFQRSLHMDVKLPRVVLLNEASGQLMVRATASEQHRIEQEVQKINSSGPKPRPNTSKTPAEQGSLEPPVGVPGVSSTANSGPEPLPLYTRIFKVDPNSFLNGLRGLRGSAGLSDKPGDQEILRAIEGFFASAGVDLSPPKSVFHNTRQGSLMVRGTLQDLDNVEMAVQFLNSAPPQLHIRAAFLDVPEASAREMFRSLGLSNTGGTNTAEVLNASQARRARELMTAFSPLGEVSVTTLGGRQAQMQQVDIQSIATSVKAQALQAPGIERQESPYQTTQVPLGPALDVWAFAGSDDRTVRMTSIATVTEFVGYDRPTNSVMGYVGGQPQSIPVPRPNLRARGMTNSAALWSGQTVLLCGAPAEHWFKVTGNLFSLPEAGRFFRSEATSNRRDQLLVFITPTIVDPAGNPLYPTAPADATEDPSK